MAGFGRVEREAYDRCLEMAKETLPWLGDDMEIQFETTVDRVPGGEDWVNYWFLAQPKGGTAKLVKDRPNLRPGERYCFGGMVEWTYNLNGMDKSVIYYESGRE